jgi:hypothetical protein
MMLVSLLSLAVCFGDFSFFPPRPDTFHLNMFASIQHVSGHCRLSISGHRVVVRRSLTSAFAAESEPCPRPSRAGGRAATEARGTRAGRGETRDERRYSAPGTGAAPGQVPSSPGSPTVLPPQSTGFRRKLCH